MFFGQEPIYAVVVEPDSRDMMTMSSSHISRHGNDPEYPEVWKDSV